MYSDRLEIIDPEGLYGRLTVDELGKVQPDTRNPLLVTALEVLGKIENRYSGIPTIRQVMKKRKLPEPEFIDTRDTFKVLLRNQTVAVPAIDTVVQVEKGLLKFCQVPRSRAEIIQYLGIASGAIRMTIPDKPRSRKQQYKTKA